MLRRKYALPAETLTGEWYHLSDPQFSTVSIIDSTAKVVERIDYNPYGHGSFHPPGDITGNGTVDVDDMLVVIYNWGNYGAGDLTRNGIVDVDDHLIVINGWSTVPLTVGQISKTNDDNVFGYCGYIFNTEALMYNARHRYYDPVHGRWLSRDPAEYIDGMLLYASWHLAEKWSSERGRNESKGRRSTRPPTRSDLFVLPTPVRSRRIA